MAGETDLKKILASLQPDLISGEFVFVSLADWRDDDIHGFSPFAAIREAEGLTLVISREKAEGHALTLGPAFRCITLRVHSSLEAVGLTASVASALARRGISANLIAGYYHDHVFVPSTRAEEALATLKALSASDA